MAHEETSERPSGLPPAEVEIDEHVVRALLRAQHPDLADLPLHWVATGWDNVTFRLGETLAVRLPRITPAVELIAKEQTWLPRLAGRLPVAIPVPVRAGRPGPEFGWPWSIVPWVPGRSADLDPLAPAEATGFGRFLAALHEPVPAGFPRSEYRGVPLVDLDPPVEQRLDRFAGRLAATGVPVADVRERLRAALAEPAPDAADERCIHADLHPKNLVTDGGRLVSVLDWGDLTAGDPATDLGATWMLFPTGPHGAVGAAYGPIPPATLVRAAGWAVFFGLAVLETGLDTDPPFAEIGRRTLVRVAADGP